MSGPDTAMVLAAGLGTRMRPLTDDRPKALVTVGGKALIDHALDRLAAAGVTRAVVNVHHFADMMEAHLAARSGPPAIEVSDERDRLLETGGALVKARARFDDVPILAANSDPVFLPDARGASGFDPLTEGFDPAREDARLLLARRDRTLGLDTAGDFHLEPDGRLRRRAEGEIAPYYYAGVQVLVPTVLENWPVGPFSCNRIWNESLKAGRLTGAVFDGDWLHVGDPEARARAEARLAAR